MTIWIATDDGAVRFESGSRRSSTLGMDNGLPSQVVSTVAVDEQYVWFGTNKGLARYRKLDRTIRVYTTEDGLPHRAVNDALPLGRQIWFATRAGLAVYDPDVDGFRAFTTADGLASDYVEELYALGEDLWCRTDVGLSRLKISNKRFTNFGADDIGGNEVRVFVPDGENVWVGTESGLSTFESTSDAFIPFPQIGSLESRSIRGVEPFTDYLFILTDQEVVQYNKLKRTFRRFTEEADGLTREAGALGTLLTSGQLTVLFPDGVSLYEITRDLWVTRSLTPTDAPEADANRASWQLWTKLDTEVPFDLAQRAATDSRYGTAAGGMGVGYQFDGDRSLDISTALDYGEVELKGIRDLQAKVEYLGAENDLVREIELNDLLKVETLEEGIERPAYLMGGHVRLASEGVEPTVSATVDGGARRGLSARDFLTGPRQEVYNLSHRYVLPGSERVYLDGELMTAGKDYTLVYSAGQLAFLDPEKVDDLSIIEVDYEYDVLPKKGLGVISLLDLLPTDNEVGAWVRSGEPTVISEESGLYNQIDGAAPKYIDRGWRRSVFVEYQQGSRTIDLAIHDMETAVQSRDIYDYDLPAAREPIADRDNMILDVGLATSYVIKAYQESFFIELSVDEKSDAAKQSLKLFALQVMDRGTSAGENTIDELREALIAARGTWSPMPGLKFGARAIEVASIERDTETAQGREQLTGILDGRYERALRDGGRLTAYAEGAASHDQRRSNPNGFATMGRLRLSHPYLEGTVSGRYLDPGYAPIGSRQTLYGNLRDETRLSATAYPTRWLPTTMFFTRQSSHPDEDDGVAVVQHALARLQLAHRQLPATNLQIGHSLLDDAQGDQTHRLKLVGETDYDFAEGILKPLGMRRFIVRGLYGLSDATTRTDGSFAFTDRVEVSRLEAKLAPTATETAYALFRSRASRRQEFADDPFDLRARHWELNAGARSAIVPGLIPQVNHTVIFDDDRQTETGIVRGSNASISGQLGIYPGDWFAVLAPVAIDARYSVANEAQAENRVRTLAHRLHRIDNRMSYNGMGAWELELREIFEASFSEQDQHQDGQTLELRNRLVFRPIVSSPITLRLDYVDEWVLNDLAIDPGVPKWGRQAIYESALEWLMRWSRRWTTKLKTTYTVNDLRHTLLVDDTAQTGELHDYVQHQVKPEIELRMLLQQDEGSFFLVQRNRLFRLFGHGTAAVEAIGWDISLGVIWSQADNIYLDAEIAYTQNHCLETQACSPSKMLRPRLLLTAKL